jgi:hypothetical protein
MSDETPADQRFAGLENASRILSADVTALTNTLQVVADLQVQQREHTAKQAATETEVRKQKEMSLERDRRQRNALRATATAAIIVLAAASFLVYFTMLNHVNGLLDQQKQDRYASCLARNVGTKENIRREQVLSQIDDTAAKRQLHKESAVTLNKSLVDCAQYR